MSALPTRLPRTVPGWLPFLWNRVLFPGTPSADARVRAASLALVVLLPAVLLYPCRGFLLLEPDEGRYAQIPKEMLAAGSWVVPTLQGEPYLDKPPLFYWLVTLSYHLFGVTESAARLVPAVCVHLTILAVYLIGRRSVGERGAFWAALLLSVSPGYLGVARLLLLDGLLTLCVTLSVLCGFEAVRTGRLKWGWWLAAAVASGLGFLTKGPISEVLLFPPLLAFGLLNRSAARVGWRPAAAFAAVVVGVNLPWYVAVYLREPVFLKHFFWEHNVLRFVRPFDHLQPVWYYVPILLGGFLPGVVVGVAYLRGFLTRSPAHPLTPSSSGGFWLLAGGWCVFFFSCSGSKLPTYILPAFPPLCLALGEFIARSGWNASWRPPRLGRRVRGVTRAAALRRAAVVRRRAVADGPAGPRGEVRRGPGRDGRDLSPARRFGGVLRRPVGPPAGPVGGREPVARRLPLPPEDGDPVHPRAFVGGVPACHPAVVAGGRGGVAEAVHGPRQVGRRAGRGDPVGAV
jgi:4-amino-4-deoxy-L-arabinose transferase-like glycosyltransferase